MQIDAKIVKKINSFLKSYFKKSRVEFISVNNLAAMLDKEGIIPDDVFCNPGSSIF